MKQLDVYYRATLDYMAQVSKSRECGLVRKAVLSCASSEDKITVTRVICTVEEDWICAIEEGLVHIGKAISEERQFIYSNGEVLPIEKVKQVSRESVRHLAKHSDLITRVEEGEDVIPDRLYTVERLNDYTVYENRFLCMLLCYLRDFITIRYDKILELSNRYDGALALEKDITLPKRRLTYRVDLRDSREDDAYMREHNPAREAIDRIDLILKTVVSFLATPLMELAAKAPPLKPPITKTNVLKMDNNFKGAVALYDFIIAYDKDGYTAEERRIDISPITGAAADELAEVGALLAFLTYERGLDVRASLKMRYDAEEERRREEALAAREERLLAIKRKLEHSEISPEEYVLELENQIKLLSNENARIASLTKAIAEGQSREEALSLRVTELSERVEKLEGAVAEADARRFAALDALRAEHDGHVQEIMTRHEDEMREMSESYVERLDAAAEELRATHAGWQEERYRLNVRVREARAEIDRLTSECERLAEEKLFAESKLKAVRAERGLMTDGDDFSDRESFEQLEAELAAYLRFYDEQWRRAKKKIRKKLLSYEYLKGQKGSKKNPDETV